MCGSTSQQKEISQQQLQAYQDAARMTKEEYGHMNDIYLPMSEHFQSIFDMGPYQEGYSLGEKQNLETQVIEGSTQNYANAARAVGARLAAGSSSYMPSGAADQMRLDTAVSAAQEKTREETQILSDSYAQGRANWLTAGQGLLNIASGYNPLGFEQAQTGAGSAASQTAKDIADAQNSWINAAIGAGGTALGGWAQGGFKHG